MNLGVVSIGILSTLTDAHLSLDHISNRARYFALNEQVQRQRQGRPVRLDIEGTDPALVEAEVRTMCARLLANPVMEDFEVVVHQ